jgi:ubiquinone/menaquinone biosynthesis C-methylase UbiE
MLSPVDRLSYIARQGARVAWYMGHYFASQRMRPPRRQGGSTSAARRGPAREDILGALGALFARDLANVERGYYPLPRDHDGDLAETIATSRLYFDDLPRVFERQQSEHAADMPDTPSGDGAPPSYFLQNFHFQTGGYLTEESAKLYDMQVEVLFSGSANAMRRQCLVPIAEFLRGQDQRKLALLDVACGTGRFLRAVKEAFPKLSVTGCDLSAAYLEEARRHLTPYRIKSDVAAAESLPYASSTFDIVTSIYLFHELPHDVRRAAAAEFARVLKPGGLLVFMDSLQLGDVPQYDPLLEAFPRNFHEPYYADYIADDLRDLFAEAGLTVTTAEPVFLSKLVACRKA